MLVQRIYNFDLVLNIAKMYFYSDKEINMVLHPMERPNSHFKQLCKAFSENWPLVIKGNGKELLNRIGEVQINLLYSQLDFRPLNPSTRNKNLIYLDLREDYSTCSIEEYLNNTNSLPTEEHFWPGFFQSIILFHFPKNCSNEYEIWTRAL